MLYHQALFFKSPSLTYREVVHYWMVKGVILHTVIHPQNQWHVWCMVLSLPIKPGTGKDVHFVPCTIDHILILILSSNSLAYDKSWWSMKWRNIELDSENSESLVRTLTTSVVCLEIFKVFRIFCQNHDDFNRLIWVLQNL